MFCVICGSENSTDAEFCIDCGKPMPKVSPPSRAALDAPPPRRRGLGAMKPSVAGIGALAMVIIGVWLLRREGTNLSACQGLAQIDSNAGGCTPFETYATIGLLLAIAGVGLGIFALVQLQRARPQVRLGSPTPVGPTAPPGWYAVEGMPGWFTWWDGASWGTPLQRPTGDEPQPPKA